MILAAMTKMDSTRFVVAVLSKDDLERMRQGRPILRYLNTLVPDLKQVVQLGIWTVPDEAELQKKLDAGEDLFRIIEAEVRRSVREARAGVNQG